MKDKNKEILTEKLRNDNSSRNAVTESLNGKEFKDKYINYSMPTKRQLEALANARARKRQLKKLREMRDAKNKKAKRALNRLRG